jgi:hypothetical protein
MVKGRPGSLSPSGRSFTIGLVIAPVWQGGKHESGGARGRGAPTPAMPHPAGISRCAADGFVSPRALSGGAFGGDAEGVFHARGQAGDRLAALAVHRDLHPGRGGVVVRAGFHGVELGTVDRLAAHLDRARERTRHRLHILRRWQRADGCARCACHLEA